MGNPATERSKVKAHRQRTRDVVSYRERMRKKQRRKLDRRKEIQRGVLLVWAVTHLEELQDAVYAHVVEMKRRAKEQRRVHRINRAARVRNAKGRLSSGLFRKLFALQSGKCACCRVPTPKGMHLDHIIPLAGGGSNEDSNIQLLCPACNISKSAKHPVDFMQSRGFLL